MTLRSVLYVVVSPKPSGRHGADKPANLKPSVRQPPSFLFVLSHETVVPVSMPSARPRVQARRRRSNGGETRAEGCKKIAKQKSSEHFATRERHSLHIVRRATDRSDGLVSIIYKQTGFFYPIKFCDELTCRSSAPPWDPLSVMQHLTVFMKSGK